MFKLIIYAFKHFVLQKSPDFHTVVRIPNSLMCFWLKSSSFLNAKHLRVTWKPNRFLLVCFCICTTNSRRSFGVRFFPNRVTIGKTKHVPGTGHLLAFGHEWRRPRLPFTPPQMHTNQKSRNEKQPKLFSVRGLFSTSLLAGSLRFCISVRLTSGVLFE